MLHRSAPPANPPGSRTRRRLLTTLGATLLVGIALATPAGAVHPAPTLTAVTAGTARTVADGGCTDQQVTVVVDLTDLGGQVEVGCGDVPATGTEALLDAGFTESRDPGGFICAVNSLPDPCPAEFTGSYWSYWHGEPGGQWQAYDEGSDTADPVAGHSEGWRYNDGSQGPGLAPAAGFVATAAAEPADAQAAATGQEATAQGVTTDQGVDQEATAGPSPAALGGIALVVLLALAGAVIGARRRSAAARGDGLAGQD